MAELSTDLILWLCILLPSLYLFNLIIFRKTSKLPPGPVGFPVVGSLLELGRMAHESLARLSQLHGPLMALQLGFITTVVVSSAEMAEQVLHKHDQAFAGRSVRDVVTVFDYHHHSLVFSQHGTRWRELRRICNMELFTPKRLDMLAGARQEKVHALLRHVHKACAAGRPVDVGLCAFGTTLNLVANTIFSKDVVDLESESAGGFKNLLWEILDLNAKPNLSDLFPALRWADPQGMRRRNATLIKRLYDAFDQVIDKRMESDAPAHGGEKKKYGDFLEVLLALTREPSSGFTRENIRPLLTDLFIAGSDTTSTTIEWAMTELLRHPDKMSTAQLELKRTIGTERLVKESDIQHLPYLQALVKETLRLHPPVPLLIPHRADVTTEVAGFTVPKNTQVLVNAWAIGRDPASWENATSFLPERFLNSDVNFKGKDFHFIPFGAGRRICPGMPLGVRMAHLVLASLLHSFSWTLPDGMVPEQLDVKAKFGITLQKAIPLKAFPSPRSIDGLE
ncbi:geraniol 8-hydroxylase-like isoform X2 [Nymphaea colorata]|uniref:geraniol 8-hydroxylase-like isoform X2 n=1 Tax=Nymphaea colorata TaxID=210225 RepID=UPI00129EE3A2|nr:geraniol 8-hydroxylase-like isoform X2 [Nymphaea colorata]